MTQDCTADGDAGWNSTPWRLSNNKWGQPSATQCVTINNGVPGWNWNNPGQGYNYPEILCGNNRGAWPSSTTPYLPIKYSDLQSLTVDIAWDYPQKPTGDFWNFAFDLYWWDSAYSKRQYNMMIWVQSSQDPGSVTYIKDVSDGYNTYKYYQGTRNEGGTNVPYDAFVLKSQPSTSSKAVITIDIKKLMNSITRTLNGSWYVPDIQLGNENVHGSGSLELTGLNAKVNGNSISIGITPPTPILTTIAISPVSTSINPGATQQLTAVCRDQNNNVMACPTLTWTSNNTSIATVNSSGLVTGVATGTANITASAGGKTSNISIITVTSQPVSKIFVVSTIGCPTTTGVVVTKSSTGDYTADEACQEVCNILKTIN
jgi:hypothetical protein